MDCIDLEQKLALFDDPWSPRIVAEANGQHLKLVKLEGPYVWHAHAEAEEVFLVLAGAFTMEFRGRAVALGPGQMIVVPRGVEHRPVAQGPCSVLLFEPAGLLSTGDGPSTEQTTAGSWL